VLTRSLYLGTGTSLSESLRVQSWPPMSRPEIRKYAITLCGC